MSQMIEQRLVLGIDPALGAQDMDFGGARA